MAKVDPLVRPIVEGWINILGKIFHFFTFIVSRVLVHRPLSPVVKRFTDISLTNQLADSQLADNTSR